MNMTRIASGTANEASEELMTQLRLGLQALLDHVNREPATATEGACTNTQKYTQ